jgi:tetratricopeptide (TPR) repeat protein
VIPEKALDAAESLLELDPLNMRAHYERYLPQNYMQARNDFIRLMRNYHENYIELAVDYGNAGLYTDAINLLDIYNRLSDQSISGYPVVYYLMGYYNHLSGNTRRSRAKFHQGCRCGPPVQLSFQVRDGKGAGKQLLNIMRMMPLHGTLPAIFIMITSPQRQLKPWERSVSVSSNIPVAYRNLAFAYANNENDPVAAIENIEKAVSLNPLDPRFYYEYDLYQKSLLTDPAARLKPFSENHDVVASDQISIFPYAELLTINGNYDAAIDLMSDRHFHRWEGGESIYLFWLYAHLFKASNAIDANNLTEAGQLVDAALSYPPNLQSVSSPYEPVAWYYKGLVAELLRLPGEAESHFMNAVRCRSGAPECDYFAARAYERMKKGIATQSIFESMIKTGEEELLAGEDMDFFDPFARVRSKHEIQANAYLRIALGYRGLGDDLSATKYYELAKEHNPAIMSLVFGN